MTPNDPPPPSPRWTPKSVAAAFGGGVLVGLGLYATSLDELDRAAHLRHTTAVVIQPADGSRAARGEWAAPDGTPRAGPLPDADDRPTGSRVPVWTDRAGTITHRPRSHATIVWHSAAAGGVVTVVIVVLTERTRRTLRRHHALDTEWRRIAPIWRRRHL